MARLTRQFFARPADVVARALLGQTLATKNRAGVIVETEAYFGPEDLASHARFGETDRNRPMFGPAGHAYVYLCYGIYDLFNVVTGDSGQAQAVLIRALEPTRGIQGNMSVARGPGKLTRAMGISRDLSGADLTESDEVFLETGSSITASSVQSGPRVGVDYAGEWASKSLRFWVSGHPSVSKPPAKRRTSKPRRAQRPG